MPENQKFSGVFSGYKMETLVTNGLKSKKKKRENKSMLGVKTLCLKSYEESIDVFRTSNI